MESQSPFEQYFDSDYAPTQAEIQDINEIIDKRQTLVNEIDDRIKELSPQIQELEEEKERHVKFIGRHRNLTTIIRGVPTDILSTIFLTLLSMSPGPSVPHPSVAISHVCHQWRRLALAMPLLWTCINLSTPTPAQHEEETAEMWRSQVRSSCDRAKAFVDRSAGLPLSMAMAVQYPWNLDVLRQLMQNGEHSGRLDDIIRQIFEVLCYANASTMERESTSLSLRVNPDLPYALAYLNFLNQAFRKSGRLAVEISYVKRGEVDHRVWEATEGKIKLNEVSCTSLCVNMGSTDIVRIEANWVNLVELSLGPGTNSNSILRAEHIIPILGKTPNIVRLTLQFAYLGHLPPLASSLSQLRVLLRRLQSLKISGDFIPAWLVKALNTPSLTDLSVAPSGTIQMHDVAQSALVAFVKEYGNQLVRVSFDYTALTTYALFRTLALLPNVEVLDLVTDHAHAESPTTLHPLLRSLDPAYAQRPGGVLNAKLKEFVCEIHEATPEAKEDVLVFIQGRRGEENVGVSVRRLEEVEVRFRQGSVDGMMEELRNRGVDTTLVRFSSLDR